LKVLWNQTASRKVAKARRNAEAKAFAFFAAFAYSVRQPTGETDLSMG
jgi:hypothetical protein